MSKLTDFQEKLLNDLRKEFDKLNVKNEVSTSSKRFSFDTIQNCIDEETKFKQVVSKHNVKMIEVFKKMILKEVKDFEKEFGKAIEIKFTHENIKKTFDSFIDDHLNRPLDCSSSSEIEFFFVSKLKTHNYDWKWDVFKKAVYFSKYLDFKCENVRIDLESGKSIVLPKIIGVQYLTSSWLYREKAKSYSSLDEMLQMDKETQRQIVNLVQS